MLKLSANTTTTAYPASKLIDLIETFFHAGIETSGYITTELSFVIFCTLTHFQRLL